MKKIVTLKVINPFHDTESETKRLKNQEFETNEKRAKEILAFEKYQLAEVLSIIKGTE